MDAGKLIIYGGIGYLIYTMFLSPPAAAATPVAAGASPTPGVPVATPSVPPALAPAITLTADQQKVAQFVNSVGATGPQLLLTAAGVSAGQTYNIYQWNYYLDIIAGQSNFADNIPWPSSTTQYTAQAYWTQLQSYAQGGGLNGVSGLGCGEPPSLAGTAAASVGGGRFAENGVEEWGWL